MHSADAASPQPEGPCHLVLRGFFYVIDREELSALFAGVQTQAQLMLNGRSQILLRLGGVQDLFSVDFAIIHEPVDIKIVGDRGEPRPVYDRKIEILSEEAGEREQRCACK